MERQLIWLPIRDYTRRATFTPGILLFRRAKLKHPKEVQYDEYDGDNDQNVNPTASFRESWTYIPTEKSEQPQDY